MIDTAGRLRAIRDNSLTMASGLGDTLVNHDTGGTDALRYVYNGTGIDNAVIQAYLKTDYDSGNVDDTYIKAVSRTDVNGRWETDMMLDSGQTYTIVFYKQGNYSTTTTEVTV